MRRFTRRRNVSTTEIADESGSARINKRPPFSPNFLVYVCCCTPTLLFHFFIYMYINCNFLYISFMRINCNYTLLLTFYSAYVITIFSHFSFMQLTVDFTKRNSTFKFLSPCFVAHKFGRSAFNDRNYINVIL